ncbi:MAG: translocation/assembly module TamB domain-containing protein [Sphingomonas fennica]
MARRIAKWVGIGLAGIVLLVGIILLGLNTSPGRRFIVDRLAGFETASGIRIKVGRIDGSIYGRMRLTDVAVSDPRGVFLTSPELTVDWRPFAYVRQKIDVREFTSPEVRLARLPELRETPTDPNAPTIPDIDLTLGRFAIDRFVVAPPVTGRAHVVRLAGSATIADGRAQIAADAAALRAAGIAGGDRVTLRLDAVPDANRFGLQAAVDAPVGGLVDSYAGLGRPLAFRLGGQGDWARWQGRLTGRAGDAPLVNLAIDGREGRFRTTGFVAPGAILTGPAARLTAPAIRLDLVTALDQRRIDTKLMARSDALAIDAAGLIDLAESRFGNLAIRAQLLTPGAILPEVRGRDIRLAATLDGAFATPTIDYRVSAAAASFGAMGIEQFNAAGRAVIDADRIRVPIHATARRVTGLNEAEGGLLTNLRIDGDIAYQNGQVASDNLRLRSDRIDATAIILADLAKGRYTGGLKGRVNDYQVNGLGRIDLVTDARLVPGARGGFGIAGKVRVMTRRIDNATVRDNLGGNAIITADVAYDLDGGARIDNLRMNAPRFRITSGTGRYTLDGRIAFRAAGQSAQYGPFALTVSGTATRPVARLTAARPNVGVQLTDVVATLEGTAAGYRVRARGGSPYGPFDADVLIRSGTGPLAVDIASATFAGIRFAGSVVQTAAGPFAGTITLAGSGLNGNVRLAAAGDVQRADVDVRASAARIPGDVPITIGAGTIRATALLYPAHPSIEGQFALTDVRQKALLVSRAQGRIRYRDGNGTVALTAAGRSGVPFEIAAQAALSPTRILANFRGQANGVPVRLARPAVVTKQGADWRLAPATIVLPQGQTDVSGVYGARTALHAVLRNLDLSIAQAFVPGLGLGGKASGTVDYAAAGDAIPDLRARIDVAGFTRTASLTVSEPVDIALLATLNGTGGDARALIRRRGATVGRMQARLAPLAAGAGVAERMVRAPLSGGIRYNGPAEVLWALGGIPRQTLTGPIAIGADFGGTLERPALNGVIRANALRYENETFGTVLSQMAIDGRFTASRFDLASLTARAGAGTISASGSVGLAAAGGFPIDLTARLQNAQLARSDALGATVSGNVSVTNGPSGGMVRGDLTIPEARYQIVTQTASAVPELTGVRRLGAVRADPDDAGGLPSNWGLDIRIRAPNQIFVSGMGLESEWRTDMRVTGTATAPSIVGNLEVVRGTYSFASRRFEIDQGTVTFQGAAFTNPALNIVASTTATDVTATITIGGYAQAPQISFTSTPALPQDEVLSRLLFGESVTSLSPTQAIQLAAALNGLRGGGGGLNPLGKLRTVAGVDRLRVLGADESAGRGTALAAGKYITNNIYVEIITDARGFTATQLEVSLSRALSVLSQTGSFGGSNVAVRYRKNY